MLVRKFWAVIIGTEQSELQDVVFEADVSTIGRQFIGGLKPEDLVAIYVGEDAREEARRHGLDILRAWETVKAAREIVSAVTGLTQVHQGRTGRHGGPRETCNFCIIDNQEEQERCRRVADMPEEDK